MINLSIIGSTGSIGTQALDIARANKDINIVALSAGSNIELLARQAREFMPLMVSVADEKKAKELKLALKDLDIEVLYGMDGLVDCSCIPEADTLLTAIVGMIGIVPTIAAINASKRICLANKETLVCAGDIIMPLAKDKGVDILPVDSEHSAIFQSLQGRGDNNIAKILLTASGGPFRGKKAADLKDMRASDALRHPSWSMGKKVTIDSSTLVNKGLEVMEACHLFGVPRNRIQVVVHPQSIIHSMVQYEDSSVIAQLGVPDMRLPIQYALLYPQRRPYPGDELDFWSLNELTFEKPDTDTFRGLYLAGEAFDRGGNMPTIFNAANECAVGMFLDDAITFLQITEIIEDCMDNCEYVAAPEVEDILNTQDAVGRYVDNRYGK